MQLTPGTKVRVRTGLYKGCAGVVESDKPGCSLHQILMGPSGSWRIWEPADNLERLSASECWLDLDHAPGVAEIAAELDLYAIGELAVAIAGEPEVTNGGLTTRVAAQVIRRLKREGENKDKRLLAMATAAAKGIEAGRREERTAFRELLECEIESLHEQGRDLERDALRTVLRSVMQWDMPDLLAIKPLARSTNPTGLTVKIVDDKIMSVGIAPPAEPEPETGSWRDKPPLL